MTFRSSRSKWWWLALVPAWMALVLLGTVTRAGGDGYPVSEGLLAGLVGIGVYVTLLAGVLLWQRHRDDRR